MKITSYLMPVLFFAFSCAPTRPEINKLPKSSEEINFEAVSNIQEKKQSFLTGETSSEYYVKLARVDEIIFQNAVMASFKFNGYADFFFNKSGKYFLANRGKRMNEWATITAVYFKSDRDFTEIYVRSEIAQDFTGGFRENRAKKVAVKIQEFLENGLNERGE